MMRRRARVDANHRAVIEALRACGWHVHDTSRLGGGFPDLVIAKGCRLEMVEVKDGAKPLSKQQMTPDEQRVYDAFIAHGVRILLVNSVEKAVAL